MPRSAKTLKTRTTKPSPSRLDRLIQEAIVDANDDSEQVLGLYTMLEDNLELPFMAEVLGMEVTVTAIELTDTDQIVAICSRGRSRQRIGLLELARPKPSPVGWEWVDAYCRWAGAR